MEQLMELVDARYVRNFQEFCGIQPQEHCRAESRVSGFVPPTQKTNGDRETENNNNDIKGRIYKDGSSHGYGDRNDSLHSTSLEQTPYIIKYKAIYYVAKVGAFFGDEIFYMTFFPFWLWNVDSLVGRQTIFVWCLVMYFGQATKDYLRWPRPPSPPVFRLETTHLQEYSMPSTHAMAGTAIPTVLVYGLCTRYEFPVAAAIALVFTWCVTVCLSRLFLGVHTVLDVLVGFLFSVVIIIVATPYFKEFDTFQQTHPSAPFVLFTTGLALCTVCYPGNDQHSAKGDAVGTVAVTVGLSYGVWLNHHLGLTSPPEVTPPYAIASPTVAWLALSMIRLFSGAFVLALVREVVTTVSIKAFSYFFGLEKPDKSHPTVQTAYKFVTYFSLGVCVLWAVPYVHKIMGICRSNFYFEVL
ncbi:sphingosine-1-phosphate phosphatase 2-like [Haliotis rufescens]|uniref:sphingosine-1-phosphate phosphatase 2-like n=1 Tax=Haliotis rufescens TaxID=6454 RepID=UPI00201E940D|nr:sphingosine-1-phosphate phosphatase 2-like [Haliotis rufescens]